MKHRLLFQNINYIIECNAIDNWIKIIWGEQQSLDSIKYGYEKVLQYLYEQSSPRLLDDQSKVKNLLSESLDWLATDWYPRAERRGLKFHAMVYTRNNFSHLSAEKLKKTLSNSIIQGFEDINVAKKWLSDLD
ncbi:MAG: hypothetical protein ACXWEY_15090 [Bacteroidia bacterium]